MEGIRFTLGWMVRLLVGYDACCNLVEVASPKRKRCHFFLGVLAYLMRMHIVLLRKAHKQHVKFKNMEFMDTVVGHFTT